MRSAKGQRAQGQRDAIEELMEPGTITSEPMGPQAVLELVVERARVKVDHYAGQCAGIDLLAYLNLRGRHLYPIGPFPQAPELEEMGWRSVSLIMERFGIVLTADRSAPKFLRDRVGEGAEWSGLDSVFSWGE